MRSRRHSANVHRMTTSDSNRQQRWRQLVCLRFATATVIGAVIAVAFLTTTLLQPRVSNIISKRNESTGGATTMSRYVRFSAVPSGEEGVLRYAAVDAGTVKELTMEDFIRLLSDPASSDLAQKLTAILREAPYDAYRFETPGVSPDTVSKTHFEFAVVEDRYLAGFAKIPQPKYFSEYLSACSASGSTPPAGCVFDNLGGDAQLVAPNDWSPASAPSKHSSCYGHLANFVRGAPDEQVSGMWKEVGDVLGQQLLPSVSSASVDSSRPIWFSTAGTGVAYLHFRLDSRPKYYLYRPFKEFTK